MRVIARNFKTGILPKEDYDKVVEIDEKIFPEFDFEGIEDWSEETFGETLRSYQTDDFMPCTYLFFVEDCQQIGIIRGNFADKVAVIEFFETQHKKKGNGRKIIKELKNLGIKTIVGYSNFDSRDFWEKIGADFSGKLMFGKFPMFSLDL